MEEIQTAQTEDDFRLKYRLSAWTYARMRKLGNAPDIIAVPGTRVRRITPEAELAWLERMRRVAAEADNKPLLKTAEA